MKWLKELWRELGEMDVPIMPITLVMSAFTIINLLILDLPLELQGLMIMLNGILIALALEE